MSEYASGYNNPPQQEAMLEVRDVLEGMNAIQLLDERERLLEEMSDREKIVHQINEVLKGYGVE